MITCSDSLIVTTEPVSLVAVTGTTSLTVASAAPLVSPTTMCLETSSSGIIPSLGMADLEKEFIAELVESFYKSLG